MNRRIQLATLACSSTVLLAQQPQWHQLNTAQQPPATGSIVHDHLRDRVVLAGGLGIAFYWFEMNDTWEWNGSTWLQRATMPGGRANLALAYDSRRARTIAYGGVSTASGWPSLAHYDAWQWDGVSWSTLSATGPAPVVQAATMCYDRERDRCVLVGRTQGHAELWEFDGTSWTLDPTTPPGFGAPSITYDRQRGRVVSVSPDATYQACETWIREVPGLAVAQPYGVGCGSPAMRSIPDAASRPLLGSTFAVDVTGVPTGIAFMCFGWSNQQVLGLSLPFAMDAFGLASCWLLQSDDAITLPCVTTGPGTARFSLAIPAHASFTGLPFFLQPWGPAPGANPGGGIVGDAVAVTIGAH